MISPEDHPCGSDLNLRSGPQGLEYDSIVARIAADDPGRVLDWGCGWGQVTRRLVDSGVETVSFDYREGRAPGTQPMERFPELEMHYSGDPVALPFADAEFDAVLSCGVLEHVADPAGSLDELHRVLKPNGTFYVYKLPNRFSYLEAVAKRIGRHYHGQWPNDRLYDMHSARLLIEAHGFEVRELRRMNMLPLAVPGALTDRWSEPLYRVSSALSKVPGLSVLATNVELVATRR